jgi:hypothetical protein
MALAAISNLVPDPASTPRPLRNKSFTFVVDVVDRKTTSPVARTLALDLAASNDLVFPGGSKSVEQNVAVGRDPVTVTFETKISGTAAGLAFFRVTLSDEAENALAACLVRLE